MHDKWIIESVIEIDGEIICIIRDICGYQAPECRKCILRKFCGEMHTEEEIELAAEMIEAIIERGCYFKDLDMFYGDDTYSEV